MTPSPHPLPLKGERAYPFFLSPLSVGAGLSEGLVFFSFNRVIASAAKQPRGLTRTVMDVPLGCFGAMRLAMTQIFVMLLVHAKPPSPPHPVFPEQAGTQTLSHRRFVRGAFSSFDRRKVRMNESASPHLFRQDRDHRVPLVQCAIYGRDGCAFIEAVGVVIGGIHEHAR